MKSFNISRYQQTDVLLHKASQTLAFLGKNLAKEKADDSHTTFSYQPKKKALVGKKLTVQGKKFRAVLSFVDFQLHLNTKAKKYKFSMEGKTVAEILEKINSKVSGIDLPEFSLHYELPATYQLETYQIIRPSSKALKEWGRLRTLANKTLKSVNKIISPSSAIHIWPHHFDTGTYHVLSKNKKEDLASVGTGFAMADDVNPKPYFYIYGWAKEKDFDFSKAPALHHGQWKTGDWKGALVDLLKINEMEKPRRELTTFFQTAFLFYQSQL